VTRTLVFDVNETLSDLRPLAGRFESLGAPGELARLWFASTLREGIALAASGDARSFALVGGETAHVLLAPYTDEPAAAADAVLEAFLELPLHPDVAPGVRALAETGARLVTLSNGATAVAERLLGDAGIRDAFAHVLSVEDAGIWKPAPGAYAYAGEVCGALPAELTMVAVHPWDLHGAARAGLRTIWIDREGRRWPAHCIPPGQRVESVGELVKYA
jgi:2-haloacid dehalogenase